MNPTEKTHYDYLPIIGGTHFTTITHSDKQWNQYYALCERHAVDTMIGRVKGGIVLDVGSSYGHWFSFLKHKGFDTILGVELDPQRAKIAQEAGYTQVFNCDASQIPYPSNTIDVAVSNDVFVHILRIEDKIAVLKEIERLLKPGGMFILNHAMSPAFGFRQYHVQEYCSFLTLHEFIALVLENTTMRISDIKPTYYNFRNPEPPRITQFLRRYITLPLIPKLLFFADYLRARDLSLEDSDYVYIKAIKK